MFSLKDLPVLESSRNKNTETEHDREDQYNWKRPTGQMRTNNEKNNPEDVVLELECWESCNYEVIWMKTCNSMTHFTNYKYKDQKK